MFRRLRTSKFAFKYITVPIDVLFDCPVPRISRQKAGHVLHGDWDRSCLNMSVLDHTKIRMCLDHWLLGSSWADTGIIELHLYHVREYGASAHGATYSDFERRYDRLDELREKVRSTGDQSLLAGEYRGGRKNVGGCLFHISSLSRSQSLQPMTVELQSRYPEIKIDQTADNVSKTWSEEGLKPFFGGSGCHRLAIALSLGLGSIPGALGVYHSSVNSKAINKL